MLVFSIEHLRSLARTFAAFQARENRGMKGKPSEHAIRAELITMGTRACDNWKFFTRLEEGEGCSARGAETATQWLIKNWPTELSWPDCVPDLRDRRTTDDLVEA